MSNVRSLKWPIGLLDSPPAGSNDRPRRRPQTELRPACRLTAFVATQPASDHPPSDR